MGLSVPIAAAIVLIGATVFMASAANMATSIMQSLADLTSNINDCFRVYARIEITNATMLNGTMVLFVKNYGPEEVLLVDQGYKWCSLIASYNSTEGWVTFLLDNYYSATAPLIYPGEEVMITASLPNGAPKAVEGSPFVIVFSTRFGEVSRLVAFGK